MKMKTNRFWIIAFFLAVSLSCSLLTRGVERLSPVDTVVPTQASSAVPPSPEIYIPPECQGHPVATLAPDVTSALPTLELEANPVLSQQEQLDVFDELVARISEVYLYPDFNGVNWDAVVADYRTRVETGMDTETFYAGMEDLVMELGDEHSQFESPVRVAEAERELSGQNDFVGVGALILPQVAKGQVTILAVFPGSSAEQGGLKQHDIILAADGVPIVEGDKAHVERVRGPECSAVVLTVQSPGEAPRDVTFIRNRVTSSMPIDARLVPTGDGSRIGYIFLPTFFDQTIPGQVRQALEDFGPLDGLILDNRMNGGGSSDVVEPILSLFADGTLGQFVSRDEERPLEITADPVNNSLTVPLVILVSEETVSFGEIFSGLLQDIGRAKLAGQTTLGNVETLSGYSFSDGSRAWLARERFDPPVSHADWEKDGIHPDLEAHADWDTFTFENDPGIAAALKLLGHSQ
jgi:carboxyl-terminal processing protease